MYMPRKLEMSQVFLTRVVASLNYCLVSFKSLINDCLGPLTDAFGRVIFTHLVADTRVIWETRSPTWDQMLMFKDLILWGDVNEIAVNPPTIVIEVFDKDIGVLNSMYCLVAL